MNSSSMSSNLFTGFKLRFKSLFDAGRSYTFRCDADGLVDLNVLSERARINYFFARALVGRDFAMPVVRKRPVTTPPVYAAPQTCYAARFDYAMAAKSPTRSAACTSARQLCGKVESRSRVFSVVSRSNTSFR